MNEATSKDPDTIRVMGILAGATRAPGDPDLVLATMIAQLAGSESGLTYVAALERLISDAHSD